MNAFADFDAGGTGSEGPWLSWGAQKEKFYLRTREGETEFTGFSGNGVVLDIDNMKTGWCYVSGVKGQAPDWRVNKSISKMEAQPGEDFKKGFKIKCAIGNGQTAHWDQAGSGAWGAFVSLVPALQQQQPGTLPLIRMVGQKPVKFAKGSTVEPVFEVVKWVPRPDCLKEGFSAGIDTGEAARPAPATTPAPASAPALADDEF